MAVLLSAIGTVSFIEFAGDTDKAAVAKGQADVAEHGGHRAVTLEEFSLVDGKASAFAIVIQDEVNNASHRIRTVLSRRAIA